MVIISQCTCLINHHVIHFKHIQFYSSIILNKSVKTFLKTKNIKILLDSSLCLLFLYWEFLFSMCFKHICNWLSKHFTMAALQILLGNLHVLYVDWFFSSRLWFSWFLVLEAILDWNLDIWRVILCDWLYDSRLSGIAPKGNSDIISLLPQGCGGPCSSLSLHL